MASLVVDREGAFLTPISNGSINGGVVEVGMAIGLGVARMGVGDKTVLFISFLCPEAPKTILDSSSLSSKRLSVECNASTFWIVICEGENTGILLGEGVLGGDSSNRAGTTLGSVLWWISTVAFMARGVVSSNKGSLPKSFE